MTDIQPSSKTAAYWKDRDSIRGAFSDLDFLLIDRILATSQAKGDLLEIGAYLGKSAILIGLHAQAGESVVVNDLFEDVPNDSANALENLESYAGLSLRAFEENYAGFVSAPPVILRGLSSTLRGHVADASVRFAHIDGSHLFAVVADDLENIQQLMAPGGIVSIDDFRGVHTPGVSAATWAAVANSGLIPICLSEAKFYGTWEAAVATETVQQLQLWLSAQQDIHFGHQEIAGHTVVLMTEPTIWTPRRLVKSMIPPMLLDKVRPPATPHLGA